MREGVVEKIVDAGAMFRGNRKHRNAERMKWRGIRFLRRRIHFIDSQHKRFAGAAQKPRQFFVERRETRLAVHNKNQQRRFFDGHLRLTENFLRDEPFLVGKDAAGVHDFQRLAAPFRFAIDAVARDARLIGDDGAPRAGQAIEQRGLAHVRASDNHQRWQPRNHECAL